MVLCYFQRKKQSFKTTCLKHDIEHFILFAISDPSLSVYLACTHNILTNMLNYKKMTSSIHKNFKQGHLAMLAIFGGKQFCNGWHVHFKKKIFQKPDGKFINKCQRSF